MKKAGFLLVTAATWYLAAMYRSVPLMALTITEVILFLGMWVQSFYFRFRVRAGFGRQLTVCRKGEEPSCSIWIESKGILPVGAVSLRMKAFYPEGSRKIRINLIGGTRRRTSRKVRLSMEKQQCGLFSVRMEKIYVYDYLTLFQRKRKEKEEMQIAILPRGYPLRIGEESGFRQEMQQSVRDADFLPGANMDEIRQLREHMQGEPYRFIHWKQSARLDKLLIKEYYQTEEEAFALFLAPGSIKERTSQMRDAFYEILFAILSGMLEGEYSVTVTVGKKKGGTEVRQLRQKEECDMLFLSLYQWEDELEEAVPDYTEEFCFDGNLRFSRSGRTIWQFTTEYYQKRRYDPVKIYGRKRGSISAAVPFSLFFLLSGIYGVYLMFLAVPQLRWNRAAVFFLAALPAMLLWYLDGKKGTNRRGLLPAGIIVVPILIGAVLFFHPSVIEEIISAALQTAGFAEAGQMDVTRGVLMILWVFSYLLFLWEFVFRVHWFLYIFMSVLLLAAPLMGIVPGSGAVLCIGIFQITFWAVHTLMKKSRQGKRRRKENMQSAMKIGAMVMAAVAAIFSVSLFVVSQSPEWFYGTAYGAEGFVQQTAKRLSGWTNQPEGGTINRGNLYPAGVDQIEIWVSDVPGETIYLKGFSGGDYAGGEWEPAMDEELFMQMNENSLHWRYWEDSIGGSSDVQALRDSCPVCDGICGETIGF